MTTNTCIICFNRLNSILQPSPSSPPSSPSDRASSPVDTSPIAHINCIHLFHLSCLQLWTEIATTCPYCRTPFDTIHISDTVEGDILRSLFVEKKQQAPENLDDFFGDVDEVELPSEYCQVCQLGGDEGIMTECDMCTDFYHINCLVPPLLIPPQATWYCESCAEIRAFAGLSSSSSSTTTSSRPRRRQRQSQSSSRPRSTPTLITNLYSRTPSRIRPNSLLNRIRREVDRQRELRELPSSLPESIERVYPDHTKGDGSNVRNRNSRSFITNPAMDMRTTMGAKVDVSVWNMVNARTGLDKVFGKEKGSYRRSLEDATEEEEEGENIWKELEMAKKLRDGEMPEDKHKGTAIFGESEPRFKRSSLFKPAVPNLQTSVSSSAAPIVDSALKKGGRRTQPVAKSASANSVFDFYDSPSGPLSVTSPSNKRKFSFRDVESENNSPSFISHHLNSSHSVKRDGTTVEFSILDRNSMKIEREKEVLNAHKAPRKDKNIAQEEIKTKEILLPSSYDYTDLSSSLNLGVPTALDLFSIIETHDDNTRNVSKKGQILYADEILGKGNEISTKTNSSSSQDYKSLSSSYKIPKKIMYSNTSSNPELNTTIPRSYRANHNVIIASDPATTSSYMNNDKTSPPSISSSPSSMHNTIAANIKHTIATHVAAKLKPYYHTGKITRDEFKCINKKVTHYLYNRAPGLFEIGENVGVVMSNEERDALVQRVVDKHITKS